MLKKWREALKADFAKEDAKLKAAAEAEKAGGEEEAEGSKEQDEDDEEDRYANIGIVPFI